jgi:hypothetical protein
VLSLVPIALVVEGAPPAIDLAAAGALAYLGVVGSGLAYVLWFRGLRLLGPTAASIIGLVNPVVGVLLSTLVGIIPNCAASVILSELYLSGAISLGALLSGLLVGAGAGWLVLFRTGRHLKKNLLILLFLYILSVGVGLLADAISLAALIGL